MQAFLVAALGGGYAHPMSTRTFSLPIILTPDHEDGGFTVRCPVIPGCISDGRTRDEALANIREAIALCLDGQAEEGWNLTDELADSEIATIDVTAAA